VLVVKTRDEFLERLRSEPRVWVRLAANRPLGLWQLSLLEITTYEPPPSWRRRSWIYERAVFLAAAASGATVARWFERERIRLKPLTLPIKLQETIQAERRRSRFDGIFERLTWPSVDWRIPLVEEQNRQMLHGELVAADAPAFISYDLAGRAFFGVERVPGGRGFSGTECVLRQQDQRARIDRVRVRPTEIVVHVSGHKLGGAMLTLGGANGASKTLRRPSTIVRFPYGGEIEAGSWIALHRGQELLDERGLDPAWGRSDVEIEVDPVTRVEVLISGGESATTEFKQQLPEARAEIRKVMRTVAAFANGMGGTILFGVDDHGVIHGLEIDSPRAAMDRVTNLVTEWVRPPVDVLPSVADVDGKSVVLLEVQSGKDAPYGVGTNDRGLEYFVRRNGTTLPARADEVRVVVQAKNQTGWR
jgi:Schlafen, AlbA_2